MLKEKLMQKLSKKGKELDPLEKSAKVGVIKSLSLQAGSMMGDKMKGLKKPVEGSVEEEASESSDKEAKEDETGEPVEGSPAEEALESPEEENAEDVEAAHADHSPEELDAKIQQLIALKHKKESGLA